jgi:hypothetical protein
LPSGPTNQTFLPALAGEGFYVDMIGISAQGWSTSFQVLVIDEGNSETIYEAVFPNGNTFVSADIGYVSDVRNAALVVQIQCPGSATGVMAINLRCSYLAASQNG